MLTDQLKTEIYHNKGRKAENTNPLLWNIQLAKHFKKEQVVPANALLTGEKYVG